MNVSTVIRKAREFGRRSVALAGPPAGMVAPQASYPARPCDAVLVLQRGANPSTGYYLEPRLEAGAVAWAIADLADDPSRHPMLAPKGAQAMLVIFCRYASREWLAALGALRPRLARVAYFVDDDLPAMMRDASLPTSVRGKIAAHYGRHVQQLNEVCGEVWMSTPALAARYPESRAAILPPLPPADPPAASPAEEQRLVYHGSDTHAPERAFVLAIADRLLAAGCTATVEITGDEAVRRRAAALSNVEVVAQLPWPRYLEREAGKQAAFVLAPLTATAVNAARAPVKAFDAARMGALGLFADAEPYRSFIDDGHDGLLLPPEPQAWAQAIIRLLGEPERRRGMTKAARARLTALRRGDAGLPPARV